MSGTDVAGDVPDKFDVVIDGYGYVTARAVDPNMPFRVQQENFSYSPTFVERQNVSNSYGDNAQDFFLTIRQRDWSLGEQQKFFRAGNDGRYYTGQNVDVSTPGQVRLAPSAPSLGFSSSVRAVARGTNTQKIVAAGTTHLFTVDSAGSIVDNGAHGLSVSPTKFGMCADGAGSNYITSSGVGTVGVRKWNGTVFSTFSVTGADSLAFLNNTLYGWRGGSGDLGRWDTAGTYTSIFTWKDAAGTAFAQNDNAAAIIEPYGGKILILFPYGMSGAAELWIYDGSGVSLLAVFPPNFLAADLEVLYGVAYVSGSFFRAGSTSTQYNRPAIHFFDGSQIGLLWQANDYNTSTSSDTFGGPHPAIVASNGKLFFTDDTMNTMLAYNPATGGVSTIGTYSAGGTDARFAATGYTFLHTRNQTTAYLSGNIAYPSSGFIESSLVDFDSSLNKVFRGVTIEFDAATDGNGGTVDVAYQVNSLAGSYTSLATGVTSGTEVEFPANTSGHSVSVKVTLNKGTSTAGPTLKSMSVRGAPILTSYHVNEYILDLGGETSQLAPVRRRDNSDHNLTGEEMRVHLAAAITSQTPVTVTDRSGTFTAMLEPSQCEFDLTNPAEWYARIHVREV